MPFFIYSGILTLTGSFLKTFQLIFQDDRSVCLVDNYNDITHY